MVTRTEKREFLVEITGPCQKVFIPPDYCTVYWQHSQATFIEVSEVGADVCIEKLGPEMTCQTAGNKTEWVKYDERRT